MNVVRAARSVGAGALAVIALLCAPETARGQTPPDLTGFWVNQYTPDLSRALGRQPPFTAEGAERWRTVDTALDPTSRCLPPGPTRAFTAPFPFLLVQHSKMVAILYEYFTVWRVVYMDGRKHPEDIADYSDFMGHSVGRWEGGALLVETVGLNGKAWLDTAGHEHSDKLRVLERFEKEGANIKWTATFEDPVFFTKPWSITRTFTPGKPGDRVMAYTCTENNRDVEHLQKNQPNLDYKHVPEP